MMAARWYSLLGISSLSASLGVRAGSNLVVTTAIASLALLLVGGVGDHDDPVGGAARVARVGLVQVAVAELVRDQGLGYVQVVQQQVRDGPDPLVAERLVDRVVEFRRAVRVEWSLVGRVPVEGKRGVGGQGIGDAGP